MARSNKEILKTSRRRAWALAFVLPLVLLGVIIVCYELASSVSSGAATVHFNSMGPAMAAAEACIPMAIEKIMAYEPTDPSDMEDYFHGEVSDFGALYYLGGPDPGEVWVAMDIERAPDFGENPFNPNYYQLTCLGLFKKGQENLAFYPIQAVVSVPADQVGLNTGDYYFSNIQPSLQENTCPWGDINCDGQANEYDITLMLGCLAGVPPPGHGDITACDLTPKMTAAHKCIKDGIVDEMDLFYLQHAVKGHPPCAPVDEFGNTRAVLALITSDSSGKVPPYIPQGSLFGGSVYGWGAAKVHGGVQDYYAFYDEPEMLDLGSSGITSVAQDINYKAQVVGFANNQAFFWEEGVMTDLKPASATNSSANAINMSSRVVGWADDTGDKHAFLWGDPYDSATWQDLGAITGDSYSEALGINYDEDGALRDMVVGWSGPNADGSTSKAFLWLPAELDGWNGFPFTGMAGMKDLSSVAAGWNLEQALAINKDGWIVGFGTTGTNTRAFLLQPTDPDWAITDLWDYTAGQKMDINSSGWVVGGPDIYDPVNGTRTLDNILIDFDGQQWTNLNAAGINDDGDIVGTGTTPVSAGSNVHAFRLDYIGVGPPDYLIADLGTLGAPTLVSAAYAVNDYNQVVGKSTNPNDAFDHAFLFGERLETVSHVQSWVHLTSEDWLVRPTLTLNDYGWNGDPASPDLVYRMDGVSLTATHLTGPEYYTIEADGSPFLWAGTDGATAGNPANVMVFNDTELTLDCNGYSFESKGTIVAETIRLKNSNPGGNCEMLLEPLAFGFPAIVCNKLILDDDTAPPAPASDPRVVIYGPSLIRQWVETANDDTSGADFYGFIVSNKPDSGLQDGGSGFYPGPTPADWIRPGTGAQGVIRVFAVLPEGEVTPYEYLRLINGQTEGASPGSEIGIGPLAPRIFSTRQGDMGIGFSQYFKDNYILGHTLGYWPPQ